LKSSCQAKKRKGVLSIRVPSISNMAAKVAPSKSPPEGETFMLIGFWSSFKYKLYYVVFFKPSLPGRVWEGLF
jgi:hypothetical protein